MRIATLAAALLWSGCGEPPPPRGFETVELRPGGAATFTLRSLARLRTPSPGLGEADRNAFYLGDSYARKPWVLAPASTTARDGLGPLFNARSCLACHVDAGRGRWPKEQGRPVVGVVMHVGRPEAEAASGEVPDPVYGDQIQQGGASDPRIADRSQWPPPSPDLALGEGGVTVEWSASKGRFDDGEAYVLHRPTFGLDTPAYGAFAEGMVFSGRVAPPLSGMGLLEAIPEERLRSLADPEDLDRDGISGRLNRVLDVETGERVTGRFGWKSKQPSLRQQIAAAFRNDMGITSSLYPDEACTPAQSGCLAAPSGRNPGHPVEIEAFAFDGVVAFVRLLGVPAPRNAEQPAVASGRERFREAGCEACHVPTHTTAPDAPSPVLASQQITPYTDLLLHDMGPDLAAPLGTYEASASEWRTPPLWGIGLAASMQERPSLLHDGRAASFAEAILWHGGEADASRTRFLAMSGQARSELIAFLGSL
jgi:CxxC motif-containing protein (DUF1111 family)